MDLLDHYVIHLCRKHRTQHAKVLLNGERIRSQAGTARVLTTDEARRLASNFANMPISRLFRLYNLQRRPRNRERNNSMSSHSIHTQSNSALHDGSRAVVGLRGGTAMTIFDQAMVTAVVSAIAYIAAILIGWL